MRILRVITVIMAVVVMIGGCVLYAKSSGKNDAPTIECTVNGTIMATTETTDEELLSYVKAHDKKDGDLTDKIKVVRKKLFLDEKEGSQLITYSVCDSDNNVSSVVKKMILSDYHSPRFSLSYDFIFPSGYTYDFKQYVEASDMIDGDLTPFIKLISSEFSNTEGEYTVNLKVSNSMADTAQLNFKAIVTDEPWFDVKVRLKDYIAYVPVGQTVDYTAQIERISYKNNDHKEYKTDDIKVDDSGVDYQTPGTYEAYYELIDHDKTITKTRLLVIVTED